MAEYVVAGMTLGQASESVRKKLAEVVPEVKVTADVTEFNNKSHYIITDGGGTGEQVVELPITGKETVLGVVARIGGLSDVSSKRKIWIARSTSNADKDQILPVDWNGITKDGKTKTNYQILPGDRLYIMLEK